MIHRFKKRGLIPKKTPVFIGGLSTKMTVIYDKYAKGRTRRSDDGFRILEDMDLQAGNRKKAGPIPLNPGAIYCLSSGMMSENTVSNQFARAGFLENPKNALHFVGYADPDSPAGHIRAGQTGDKVVGIVSRANLLHALARLAAEAAPTTATDTTIREQLLAELAKEKWAPTGALEVIVRDGVVDLWGTITDERERQALVVAAENIPGVKRVNDHVAWIDPMSGMVFQPPNEATELPKAG